MALTIVTTPSGGVSYTDNGNTVYLEKREPSRSGARRETTDTWGGSSAAIRAMYARLSLNRMAESMRIAQNGAASTLTVTWPVDAFSGETPQDDGIDEADADRWSLSPIEIPTALAAHPYFQTGYEPGAGAIIEDGIAAADLSISNGEPHIADGAYKDYTSRYYALRMAGVEEWPQLGVQISRSFNTTELGEIAAVMDTVNQVVQVGAIAPPAGILAAIAALKKIDSYESSDPATYVLIANAFEWLHRPPDITLNMAGDVDRYNVRDMWWGVWKWSAVLYPGGTWDPQGEVTP